MHTTNYQNNYNKNVTEELTYEKTSFVYHGNGRIKLWNVDTGWIPTMIRHIINSCRQIDKRLLSMRVQKIQLVT